LSVSGKNDHIIRIQYSVTILVPNFYFTLRVVELQCVRYTVLSREETTEETDMLVRLITKFP